jgi:ribosomal protein S11
MDGGFMRKVWIPLLIATITAGIVFATVQASPPVWTDNFDTGANWVNASTANFHFTTSNANGKYIVENTGSNFGIIKSDRDYTNFTYSVSFEMMSSSFSMTGIAFCMNQLKGYLFTISDDKQWAFQKIVDSSTYLLTKTIEWGKNGFITQKVNELKVSKNNNTFTFFCNGTYLGQAQDDSYSHGIIGLYLYAKEKAAFDNASIWSEPQTGAPLTYFKDNFDNSDMFGWYVQDTASVTPWVTEGDGVLRINNNSSYNNKTYTMVLSNGNYNKGPVRAVSTFVSGDSMASYGLVRMALRDDGNFSAFVYSINKKRLRGVFYLRTNQAIQYSLNEASAISIGPTDTLEIQGPPDYQFYVNGQKIPEIDWGKTADTLNFNMVGFYADSGVSVQFDNFAAGDSNPVPVMNQRGIAANRPSPIYMVGGVGIIYDPLGRKIGQFQHPDAHGLRNKGTGQYFIAPESKNRKSPIQRAIIVK